MNSNQEIKQENREIALRCCWATYCSKASRRGIPPSSLMSLLESASSASWTMIQTYITKKAKFNLTEKFPKCTPPLQAKPSIDSCPVTYKHFTYVLTKPPLSRYFFSVGCRFMEVSIIITGFVSFFEQKLYGLFKDTFPIFSMTLFSAKKGSWVDVFLSSSITWVFLSRRSFCVCSFFFVVLLKL